MIIRNITVENFQSYYDTQVLEFSKGLNIVVGNGGKGKSKLFNAFYWVLFGKIYITGIGWCSTDTLPNSAKFSMKRQDFINKKALYGALEDESVKTSVIIELEDDKGQCYQIERVVSALRLKSDNWELESAWEVGQNMLKISFDSSNGTMVKNDIAADDKINDLFPESIRNYIWFQGESLESLINFRKKETLKAAVKHISYFPFYEKLSDIIVKSKKKILSLETKKLREANKKNKDVRDLLSIIDSLNYKIGKEEENKGELESRIDIIKITLADGETKMSGLASFSTLVSKYKTCENEIATLNNEINSIDKFQRQQLPKLWLLRGTESMIDGCKQIIENHKEEENTVPEKKYLDNPSRSKLKEIVKDKKCFVCGSDVIEGNNAYEWIHNRLNEQDDYLKEMEDFTNNMQFNKQFNMFIGKIQDYPDSLRIPLSTIDKQWNNSEENLEKQMVLRRKKLDEKRKLDDKIEEVKKKYGVDPVKQAETAGIVDSKIRASRSILEREQRKLETSKQTISNFISELRNAERDLEKIGKKENFITKVSETEWKNISTFLEDICKRVQENARTELLQKIEVRANKFYKKFTEHDIGYKGIVKIGDDYSIEFDAGLNTSHEDRKKMSIINALLALNQEAIGTYYPFISDAPTSSFDLETTFKYLLGIKDIFGQSIIMTKDVDLDSEKYKELVNQNNVARIYRLDSELYCDKTDEPDLHEVSTKATLLK